MKLTSIESIIQKQPSKNLYKKQLIDLINLTKSIKKLNRHRNFTQKNKVFLDFMMEYTILSQLSIDLISILRWPVAYLALAVCAMSNYFILPCIEGNDKIKFRSVLPGTLFFCLFWMLGSWSFSLYLSNLNTYNKVFGTIGAFALVIHLNVPA